jgi:hypothetical protein
MKKLVVSICVAMLALATFQVVGVQALGTNITQFDGVGQGTIGWNSTNEDEEVAWNCVGEQKWDLEGMFLQGSELSLVGGFNFASGEQGFLSGDIFIDVNGDFKYGKDVATGLSGEGNKDIQNKYGYDYAIDLKFNNGKLAYDVYKIDGNATLQMGWYRQNDTSGAWQYKNGGALVQSGLLGGYQTGLSDAATGFKGGSHNALSLDLSFLGANQNFTAQFTMGCGNDLLVGKGTTSVVATPEPGTLVLVGLGLVAAALLNRKKRS